MGNIGLSTLGDIAYNLFTGNYSDALSDAAANYLLPGGGRQIQRTIEGAQSMGALPQLVSKTDENGQEYQELVKEPIYYTGSGDIGFVNDPENVFDYMKALLFGRWTTDPAREYIDNGFRPASKTETELFNNLNSGNTTEAFNLAQETFEAKKEYSTKEEFIGYLDSAPYTDDQKNEIIDTYYGDNTVVSSLNGFASQYGLDPNETYQLKSYGINQHGVLDENGKNISNTKALNYRKQLTDMGLYDSLVDYVASNGLEPKDVGLTKTVINMDNSEFEYEYNRYFNSDGSSKTVDNSTRTYRSRSSGRRSTKKASSYGMSNDDYTKTITKIDNIMSDALDKLVSNSTSVFDFNIEPLDLSDFKVDVENILKTDTDVKDIFDKYKTSNIEDLIDDYLDDHPYSYLFS